VFLLDTKNNVSFISTDDPKFTTIDGFAVGASFQEIFDKTGAEIQERIGYGFFISLSDEWKAGFPIGQTASEGLMSKDSVVSYFFKDKYK